MVEYKLFKYRQFTERVSVQLNELDDGDGSKLLVFICTTLNILKIIENIFLKYLFKYDFYS